MVEGQIVFDWLAYNKKQLKEIEAGETSYLYVGEQTMKRETMVTVQSL